MDNRAKQQNTAKKTAQKFFTKANQADGATKDTYVNQHAATAAKIAKLRKLRLAKEAQDKEEADRLAVQENPVGSPLRRAPVPVKPAKRIRWTY